MDKDIIGMTTLEVVKMIVRNNPNISSITARSYFYVPFKPSMEDEKPLVLSREEFLEGVTLDNFIASQDEGWNVAIDSTVALNDGQTGHLPMLDLAPRKSDEALASVIKRIGEIIKPHFGGGFVLETNKSYHYLGDSVFNDNRYAEFLGRSLISSIVIKTPDEVPNIHEHIVDYRYVGYALMRHSSGLRITARGDKQFLPKVIARV